MGRLLQLDPIFIYKGVDYLMENVIVNLDGAIAGIKIEEQKLLAEHITQINIYNTELSGKVIEETLKKLSELKSWKETIEQTKQAIVNSKKILGTTPMITKNIPPTIVAISSSENLQKKLRTLDQHRFLFSTLFLMTDIQWSKEMFGLEYPFAKNYSDEMAIHEQIQDETGEIRYWQEVFILGTRKFLITNQWTKESKKNFDTWYENITQQNNETKGNVVEKISGRTPQRIEQSSATSSNDLSKKPKSITLLGKKYTIEFWSEVFTKVCEIMVLRKPYLAAKFDQEMSLNSEQVNFSYQEKDIKTDRKKLSNGMWLEINRTAKESLQLAIQVLEFCGYSHNDMLLEY